MLVRNPSPGRTKKCPGFENVPSATAPSMFAASSLERNQSLKMCGRAAQTRRAMRAAEDALLGHAPPRNTTTASREGDSSHRERQESAAHHETEYDWQDNYNMSPGMSCTIFFRDDDGTVQVGRKLMFNARSDTLLDKRSFAPLFARSRTCLIVVDGFFEWKPAALKGGKKQPYFVFRNKEDTVHPYLMFAGLWTSVPTGRGDMLDTFTIITTEACSSLEWLHSRMPLTIYNEELARQWLEKPSRALFRQIDEAVTPPDYFQWHAVTTEMNSTKYRSENAIKAVPPPVSVKSFFSVVKKGDKEAEGLSKGESEMLSKDAQVANDESSEKKKPASSSLKRSAVSSDSSIPTKKQKSATKEKKGSIATFFSPKSNK